MGVPVIPEEESAERHSVHRVHRVSETNPGGKVSLNFLSSFISIRPDFGRLTEIIKTNEFRLIQKKQAEFFEFICVYFPIFIPITPPSL